MTNPLKTTISDIEKLPMYIDLIARTLESGEKDKIAVTESILINASQCSTRLLEQRNSPVFQETALQGINTFFERAAHFAEINAPGTNFADEIRELGNSYTLSM